MLNIGLIIIWVALMQCGIQKLPVCPTVLPQNTCWTCEEASASPESLNWNKMGFHAWEWHPAPLSNNTILIAKRGLFAQGGNSWQPSLFCAVIFRCMKSLWSIRYHSSFSWELQCCVHHVRYTLWCLHEKLSLFLGKIIICRSTCIRSGWDGVSLPHSILHSIVLCRWKLLKMHQCFGCC